SLPESTKARLTEILLGLHEHEEGRAVLRKYFKLQRFEEISASDQADIDWMRKSIDMHHSR
ncbi:MAG: hypothetical protein JJ899_17800, partial [Alphaproteobacteria bacterium]|nr:hypothetical protein [Alphaproteobacteria bacterium]